MQLDIAKDYRNKFGVIDLNTHNLIVPYEFDEIVINDTCIRLKLDGKWGIISVDDLYKVVYKLKYSENNPFDIFEDD